MWKYKTRSSLNLSRVRCWVRSGFITTLNLVRIKIFVAQSYHLLRISFIMISNFLQLLNELVRTIVRISILRDRESFLTVFFWQINNFVQSMFGFSYESIIVYVCNFISGVALIYGITTRITLLSILAFVRTWFIYLFQYDVRESRRLIVLKWRIILSHIRSASPRHWISDPSPRLYLVWYFSCILIIFT